MRTRTTPIAAALFAAGIFLSWLIGPLPLGEAWAQDKQDVTQPATVAGAGQPGEPLGGQPPVRSKPSVSDFDYQIKYHRAFEAVLWNMPAIAIYSFRRAAFDDLGAKDNDIIAYSATATPKLEALTANSTTPYIAAYTDLRNGPVVLEVPAAGADGSLYGQVVDAWQFTIADVGPAGIDKGKGGKILFTPPNHKGETPPGYLHVASPNYRIALAFRSIPADGKTAADAYAYTKRLRMYYLSEAANPPKQKFIDPTIDRYATLPFYDERHFKDMHDIMTVEPVKEHDKVMLGMLASIGIELTERAAMYFWATYVPKVLSDTPATQYLAAMADKDGKLLVAGKTYKINVPANMPVKQFWALTVYDRATFSFIYSDSGRTTLSSKELDSLKKNNDGSVTLYVGPAAPRGMESNWIPTQGKRPLPTMRFYGPTQPFHDKSFKLPDFELVN